LSNPPLHMTENCIARTCQRNIWFYLSRTKSKHKQACVMSCTQSFYSHS